MYPVSFYDYSEWSPLGFQAAAASSVNSHPVLLSEGVGSPKAHTTFRRALNLFASSFLSALNQWLVQLLPVINEIQLPGVSESAVVSKLRGRKSCFSMMCSPHRLCCALPWKMRAGRYRACSNPHELELWKVHIMACHQWLSISSGVQIGTFKLFYDLLSLECMRKPSCNNCP